MRCIVVVNLCDGSSTWYIRTQMHIYKDLQYTNEIFVERKHHPHPPRWQVDGAWDLWCLLKLIRYG